MALQRYRKTMEKEMRTPLLARELAVEFVSTFILVSVQCALPLSWDKATVGTVTQTGLGMGFIVCITIWALGEMGLVLMNPALTLAFMLANKMTLPRGFLYIVIECLGGIAGAAFVYAVTPEQHRETLAATILHKDVAVWQGLLIEIWLTFIFILILLGSIDTGRKANLFMHTLPIGLAVAVAVMSGSQSTGASINPARSLGPALMMSLWEHHWIYWVGPMGGAALATFMYKVVFDMPDNPKGPCARGKKALKMSTEALDADEKSGMMGSVDFDETMKSANGEPANGV